jgi:uncharacterized protein YndB with AHSA1/START domain
MSEGNHAMSQLTVTKTINAPIDTVWPALADFGGIHRFHPGVKNSYLLNDKEGGVGAQRVCEFYDGNSITEEVSGWEDGCHMTVDITKGSLPIRDAAGTIEVTANGEGTTRIDFTVRYEPKFGPLGKVMDVVMMRPNFRKLLGQVIDGLETHVQTGALIGKDGEPITATAAA